MVFHHLVVHDHGAGNADPGHVLGKLRGRVLGRIRLYRRIKHGGSGAVQRHRGNAFGEELASVFQPEELHRLLGGALTGREQVDALSIRAFVVARAGGYVVSGGSCPALFLDSLLEPLSEQARLAADRRLVLGQVETIALARLAGVDVGGQSGAIGEQARRSSRSRTSGSCKEAHPCTR